MLSEQEKSNKLSKLSDEDFEAEMSGKRIKVKKNSKNINENDDKFSGYTKTQLDNIPIIKENVSEKTHKSHHKQEIVVQEERPIVKVEDLSKPRQTHEAGKVMQNQVARPPMDESGDIDLNKLFSSEVGNESDVVKELFSSENIKVKTELTKNEISIISRLELQASMTQNFFLAKVIKEYETLLVSKDRKSRQEFVNSFRGIGDQNSGATAFSKLGNIFNKDKV